MPKTEANGEELLVTSATPPTPPLPAVSERWRSHRLRAIPIGVRTTLLLVPLLLGYLALEGGRGVNVVGYVAIVAVALVGVLVVAVLPWDRLLERRVGLTLLHAWSALDIGLIALLVAAEGDATSELFYIYVLTTAFSAAIYTRGTQVVFLAMSVVAYVMTVALIPGRVWVGTVVLRVGILGVTAFITGFLANEFIGEMEANESARRDTEDRARLVDVVARATRTMSSLDPDRVLAAVSDAVMALGFDAVNLCVLDPDGATYRTSHTRGLPTLKDGEVRPRTSGIAGVVLERDDTVVVENYSEHPRSDPSLRAAGFRGVIAAPVRADGRSLAVLLGGSTTRSEFVAAEVAAFELLAAQAGRALENAHRYDEQRLAVEELARLDEMKSDFVSNVSHELRTPLTVILGLASTLQKHWDELEEGQRRDLTGRVALNAETLDHIIGTLLDFSRLEAGQLTLSPRPIDLAGLVRTTSERLAPLLSQHSLTVDVPEGVAILADGPLLDRVLENLLVNAARHTPPGTHVTVAALVRDRKVEVVVVDDGPGIPPEEVEHVLERFYRGGHPNARRTRGLGLGLALCAEILRLHGSELHVDSTPTTGTRFTFVLPRAASLYPAVAST